MVNQKRTLLLDLASSGVRVTCRPLCPCCLLAPGIQSGQGINAGTGVVHGTGARVTCRPLCPCCLLDPGSQSGQGTKVGEFNAFIFLILSVGQTKRDKLIKEVVSDVKKKSG